LVFFDTSALVKAYLDEPGTATVQALISRLGGQLHLSRHVALETLATFSYKFRDRRIQRQKYRSARSEFLRDFPGSFNVLDVKDDTLELAMKLADAHRGLGVGSLDLIHIATVMQFRSRRPDYPPFTIVCADRSMRLLAAAAGFDVFDPETDELARLDSAEE
jgi:predicted nucleic acid-binding protein